MSGEARPFDATRFDAALAALPEATPASALQLFRQALREGRAALRDAYQPRANVDVLLQRHAQLVDELLTRAWALHASRRDPKIATALVAVGGYGRGELFPCSDIDLLLLLQRADHKRIQPFAEAFLQFLWDIGLEVGHSVRSLSDCVTEARKDVTVATNLMEARLLQGDATLFEAMRARTGADKLWPSARFFAAKLAEQRARHARFEDTAYNLEPTLKEGPGGLRDIQTIAWVTQRHFATASLHELVGR